MSNWLLDFLFKDTLNAEEKGKYGETLIDRKLKLLKLFGRNGKILKNIYVPKDNGETSEIDVIFITQKGIYVIESKNFSGWIFGDEKAQYWTAMLANKTKNRFYNPIKQNKTHIKWLSEYLSDEIPFISVIVFSNRCELKKITVLSNEIKVIQREQLYETIKTLWDRSIDVISKEKVEELYYRLLPLTNVENAVKAAHIETIKNNYIKPIEKKKETPTENLICPKCGAGLILRTTKRGANIGKQFYGCSSYPNCRFMRDIT